jgi:hypothetical protein
LTVEWPLGQVVSNYFAVIFFCVWRSFYAFHFGQ